MRLIVLLLAVLLGACSQPRESSSDASGGSAAPERVTILLNWFPESQHGGFYAAQVYGYYAEAGLEVEIVAGGVDIPVESMVATGQHTFGVANADNILMARAAEAPLVALFAPLQRSPRVIMVHEDSGIDGLEDLNNITLAMNPKGAFAQFVQSNYPLENVKIVPYPGSISVFLTDRNFAQQAYNISEPFTARANGGNPRNIFLADYGFNPYTSVLFTRESVIADSPDLVRRVVEASARGWQKYVEDPARTNARILELNPQMNPDILAFGAQELRDMVLTEEARRSAIGIMTEERWNTLTRQLEELELIAPGAVPPADVYTTRFLPASGGG